MRRKTSATIQSPIIPQAGTRVGSVSGPGQFPKDNAGTVMAVITDRWGAHALVMMDSGSVAHCHGMNRGPGIGWHAL